MVSNPSDFSADSMNSFPFWSLSIPGLQDTTLLLAEVNSIHCLKMTMWRRHVVTSCRSKSSNLINLTATESR